VGGSVDTQYLVGSFSPRGHSISTIPPGVVAPSNNPMSRTHANGGKTGLQLPVRAFPPSDFLEGRGGQAHRNCFTETG